METNKRETHHSSRYLLLLLAVSLLLIGTVIAVSFAIAKGAVSAAQERALVDVDSVAPSCRFGVASANPNNNPFLTELGVGWTLNFGVRNNLSLPNGIEYVHMVRLGQKVDAQGRLPEYFLKGSQLTDDPGGLGSIVAANPNRLWIIGNEIDRVVWQDDIFPQIYAEAYHDIYHFIKKRDPSAQIAVSGLVGVTPNRMEYLDMVWDSYLEKYGTPMPVDVWTLHPYIFPEAKYENGKIVGSNATIALQTSCDINRDQASCSEVKWESLRLPPWISPAPSCSLDDVYCYTEHDDIGVFAQQVVMMRQWMKDHGHQNKPLINTEFAVLYPYIVDPGNPPTCFLQDEFGGCFTPQRVIQFMQKSIQYQEETTSIELGYPLDNYRLVQQWLWYAMNDGSEGTPNALVNDDKNPTELTTIGRAYKQLIANNPKHVNILGAAASNTAVHGTDSAEIWASIRNNGNVPTGDSFKVTFYEDADLTKIIDTVTVPPALGGCARYETKVSVSWSDLQPIVNQFWAVIESVEDPDHTDNTVTGFVLVDPEQSILPVISR